MYYCSIVSEHGEHVLQSPTGFFIVINEQCHSVILNQRVFTPASCSFGSTITFPPQFKFITTAPSQFLLLAVLPPPCLLLFEMYLIIAQIAVRHLQQLVAKLGMSCSLRNCRSFSSQDLFPLC